MSYRVYSKDGVKEFTRREFVNYLRQKGQVIPLSKCNKKYKRMIAKENPSLPTYVRYGTIYAVDIDK